MQTKHPITTFDLDSALVNHLGHLTGAFPVLSAPYFVALQQEMKAADFTVSRYRVTIEAVPEGEEPNFEPMIEYRDGS